MFRFGDALVGGVLAATGAEQFAPCGECRGATLDLWEEPETPSIAVGTPFAVWYGEDVGQGTVTGLDRDA